MALTERRSSIPPLAFSEENASGEGRISVIVVSGRASGQASLRPLGALAADVEPGAADRLRSAHRLETLGCLSSSLAHDLNNMLSVIIGSLELAGRASTRGQDPARDLERGLVAAERSAAAIADLLHYARPGAAGETVLHVDDVVLGLRSLLERSLRRGLSLVLEVAPTGPVRVSPQLLETAVLNLVLNAREAKVGQGTVWIACDERCLDAKEALLAGLLPGRFTSLRVADDGDGIPAALQARVFEPFFSTRALGTGLGLAMVHDFVEGAGGAVLLSSSPGEGTTVELLLPVALAG